MADDLPVHLFATRSELEAWFEDNHDSSLGFWLKIAKKGAGVESVDYAEALELALCSVGSTAQINRNKAEELIAAGAMRPAGLAEVEARRALDCNRVAREFLATRD